MTLTRSTALRVNLEQAPAFRPGSRVVHLAEHYEKKHVWVTGGVGFKWISKRGWDEL